MEMKLAVAVLATLGQEHRLAVFRLLVRVGAAGQTAGEIAAALNLPQSSLSFHLSALERVGVIHPRRDGRYIYYRVEPETIRNLLQFLAADCCGGQPELCGVLPRIDASPACSAIHYTDCSAALAQTREPDHE